MLRNEGVAPSIPAHIQIRARIPRAYPCHGWGYSAHTKVVHRATRRSPRCVFIPGPALVPAPAFLLLPHFDGSGIDRRGRLGWRGFFWVHAARLDVRIHLAEPARDLPLRGGDSPLGHLG